MQKKSVITISFIGLFSIILFLGYLTSEKIALKKELKSKIQTLSLDRFFNLDSIASIIPTSSNVCLIHFNSGCEHCQYQIRDIKSNLYHFMNVQVIFISSENISLIKKTSEDFGLSGLSNVSFVKINSQDVYDTYGQVSFPHIFIYDRDRKLIKEFRGETKVDALLKYLQ